MKKAIQTFILHGITSMNPLTTFTSQLPNIIIKKVNNLKRNTSIYYCVDDPNPPYKGVRGIGNATIRKNINNNATIAEKIMLKYLGSLEQNGQNVDEFS